jgi:hypothetical protein
VHPSWCTLLSQAQIYWTNWLWTKTYEAIGQNKSFLHINCSSQVFVTIQKTDLQKACNDNLALNNRTQNIISYLILCLWISPMSVVTLGLEVNSFPSSLTVTWQCCFS